MPVINRSYNDLPASNRHANKFFDDALKGLHKPAQNEIITSIKSHGFPIYVYNQLHTGVPCTCNRERKLMAGLDSEGNLGEAGLSSLLGGTTFGVSDYTESLTQQDVETPHTGPATNEYDTPERVDSDTQGTEMEYALGGPTSKSCGICLNTGFVGGYAMVNANRIILDPTFKVKRIFGGHVNTTDKPYRFEITTGGKVEFDIIVPFFHRVLAIRVMNNAKEVAIANVTLNGAVVTIQNLVAAARTKVTIGVSDVSEFTHLELILGYRNKEVYGDFPNFSFTGDLTVEMALEPVRVVLDPRVPMLQVYDLFTDTVYGFLWRVMEFEPQRDKYRNVYGWVANVRLVQRYEVFSSLWRPLTPPVQFETAGQDITERA